MVIYNWNLENNSKLKQERGIGFEDIIAAINKNNLLDVIDHPNQEKYPNQKIFVVSALGYVYLVPYINSDKEIFLKTIIPSRKAKKAYQEKLNV